MNQEKTKSDLPHLRMHYAMLARLLKNFSAERFKRMARDEVLFKYIADRFDPALLVDHLVQAEKEAADLAEMSLLQLVDSDRLDRELEKSAAKIESHFSAIAKTGTSPAADVITARKQWLDARVQFYRQWLSVQDKQSTPMDLAKAAFHSAKKFRASLQRVLDSENQLASDIVKHTEALHRFLVRKHLDHELKGSIELWDEFALETFREMPALS